MIPIARFCAAALCSAGVPATTSPALRVHRRARDSVGLDAAARIANLAGRIRAVANQAPPPGARVVLLDDVITTGATAAACVAALGSVGVPVTAVLALTTAG
jgi:predicted amidophosphoribosyltransferase